LKIKKQKGEELWTRKYWKS